MPRLTNQYNYPPAVIALAESSLQRPDPDIIRVTSLIQPPALRLYQLTHWDKLVVDVDDFVVAGFGTAWHAYLGQFATQIPQVTWYSEDKLRLRCGDLILQGTMDMRSAEGTIEDYKVTSCWSFVFGKPEWEQQLNTYALLCAANDIPITSLAINAFLRDWSLRNAQQYAPQYPKRPFIRMPVPLWDIDKRKEFVRVRLADHAGGMRPCTPEERWQRPTTYAVMRKGIKKAKRVLDSASAAMEWMGTQKDKALLSIVERPGACRRCEDYCFVRSVCEFRNQGA